MLKRTSTVFSPQPSSFSATPNLNETVRRVTEANDVSFSSIRRIKGELERIQLGENGEEWLHFRRIMNKLMLRSDSGISVVEPCELVANDLVKSWKEKYAGRELIQLESELYRWAIDIMISVFMGDKYHHHRKNLDHMVSQFASVVHLIFQESARLSLIPAKLAATLKIPAWRNFTAYSTQWMLYLLAKHKQLQEELYEEVQGVSNPDDIIQLPLLRGVMRETLRLYPELVLLSLYTSGRDSKNFSKPNDFWPARWCRDGTTGNYKGVYSPYASLPFGMGVRSCIGRKIAEVQMTLAIAKVVQQLKLELIEKEPIDMLLRLVAVPSRPVRLWLTER
ncbi:hypothetical protein C0J52_09617 [Blattella germanica]|nr:hypothetical protein C0J52_09617 [Blattella germanica]